MHLEEAQRRVDHWIQGFEEGYWPPLVNFARLSEEVGELARELNHMVGLKTKKASEPDGSVAEELGDILFTLICLANSLQVRLDSALEASLEKARTRDRDRWTPRKRKPARS